MDHSDVSGAGSGGAQSQGGSSKLRDCAPSRLGLEHFSWSCVNDVRKDLRPKEEQTNEGILGDFEHV